MDKNKRTPEEDLPKEKKLQLYISKAISEYDQGAKAKFIQIMEELGNKDKSESILRLWMRAFINQANESYKNREDLKLVFISVLNNVKWFESDNHLKLIDLFEEFLLVCLSYNSALIENTFKTILSNVFSEESVEIPNTYHIGSHSFHSSEELLKYIKSEILFSPKYYSIAPNELNVIPLDSIDEEFMFEFFKNNKNFSSKFAHFNYIALGNITIKEKSTRCFFVCEGNKKIDISYLKTLAHLQEKINLGKGINPKDAEKLNCLAKIISKIFDIYPLSRSMGLRMIQEEFPHKRRTEKVLVMYLYFVLLMTMYQPKLSEGLFSLSIEKLVSLDVEIRLDSESKDKNDEIASKLDGLMSVFFDYIEYALKKPSQFFSNLSLEPIEFEELFQNILLISQEKLIIIFQSKYVQFLLFYMCSFVEKYPGCVEKFLSLMICNTLSKSKGKTLKMHSLCYLGSFLARANFIPEILISKSLDYLLDFLLAFEPPNQIEKIRFKAIKSVTDNNLIAKSDEFYQKLQAVLYIFCYHDFLINSKQKKFSEILKKAQQINLLNLLSEDIRQEFSATCEKLGFAEFSKIILFDLQKENNNQIEFFYPFDPYLLRKSWHFLKNCYQFWNEESKRETDEKKSDSEEKLIDCNETDSSSPWIIGEQWEGRKRRMVWEDEGRNKKIKKI